MYNWCRRILIIVKACFRGCICKGVCVSWCTGDSKDGGDMYFEVVTQYGGVENVLEIIEGRIVGSRMKFQKNSGNTSIHFFHYRYLRFQYPLFPLPVSIVIFCKFSMHDQHTIKKGPLPTLEMAQLKIGSSGWKSIARRVVFCAPPATLENPAITRKMTRRDRQGMP